MQSSHGGRDRPHGLWVPENNNNEHILQSYINKYKLLLVLILSRAYHVRTIFLIIKVYDKKIPSFKQRTSYKPQ